MEVKQVVIKNNDLFNKIKQNLIPDNGKSKII